MRVQRAKLAPGMKLGQDVVHADGRLLIPSGAELTEKQISAFESWEILSAEVSSESAAELEAESKKLPLLSKNELERIRTRFKHVDLEGEFAEMLFDEIAERERRVKAGRKADS